MCADHTTTALRILLVQRRLRASRASAVARHPCISRPGSRDRKGVLGFNDRSTIIGEQLRHLESDEEMCNAIFPAQRASCSQISSPIPSRVDHDALARHSNFPSSPCCRARAVPPGFLSTMSRISTLLKGGDVYLNKLLAGF
jgi:hypothetical protein